MLGMELLGGPADDRPKGLRDGCWFGAGHLLKHGDFAVAINEMRGCV